MHIFRNVLIYIFGDLSIKCCYIHVYAYIDILISIYTFLYCCTVRSLSSLMWFHDIVSMCFGVYGRKSIIISSRFPMLKCVCLGT